MGMKTKKYGTVKILTETHDFLRAMKKRTKVPISLILEAAVKRLKAHEIKDF